LKTDIENEENKCKKAEYSLKKQYDDLNNRNNTLANELQQLRRSLANLNEQMDYARETERQILIDYDIQVKESSNIQKSIEGLLKIKEELEHKRVNIDKNQSVIDELDSMKKTNNLKKDELNEMTNENIKLANQIDECKKQVKIYEE